MSALPFDSHVRRPSGAYAVPTPLIDGTTTRPAGSRRRRLWELPHRFHCPLIGVCFSCDELRGLMRKVMHFPPETSDYVLHTTAVGNCEQRCRLAELLQRMLELRHRLTVKGLAPLKSADALRLAWQRACADGANVPGTLWACWTHPALDATLEQEIFGDIHMLQHQLGSGTRADLKAMQTQCNENADLRRQLDAAHAALEALRGEKAEAVRQLELALLEVRSDLVAADARSERLVRECDALRAQMPDLPEREVLLRRAEAAERRIGAAHQRAAAMEKELLRLRAFARHAEETIEALAGDAEGAAVELPERDLSGKRVLCVGGRSGSLSAYREVVEQSGGQFLHHDGGLEESVQRIDNVVAAADIVICQAGCISHNAYWRVKEHCKRTGKPCVFVKSAGVASFDRAVDEVGRRE